MKFKKWMILQEEQQMFFSTKPKAVYHGSNSGKDNSVANNFKQNGVNSQVADGWGQGHGFYVWSDKNTAIHHANQIISNNNMQTNAVQDGLPMVVTVEAILEPESWDFDYETNKRSLLRWLHSNWESVKGSLTSVLNIDRTRRVDKPAETLASGDTSPAQQGFVFNRPNSNRRSSMMIPEPSDDWGNTGNIGSGELLGQIFQELQKGQNKNLIHQFEEVFFANLPPKTAIKYVGQQNLPVKSIEVLQNGQWIAI
jgi:hypothetical protein